MTKEELGITKAGEAYIDAIIAHGQHERVCRIHRLRPLPHYVQEVNRTRALVRIEAGVGDAEDFELSRR